MNDLGECLRSEAPSVRNNFGRKNASPIRSGTPQRVAIRLSSCCLTRAIHQVRPFVVLQTRPVPPAHLGLLCFVRPVLRSRFCYGSLPPLKSRTSYCSPRVSVITLFFFFPAADASLAAAAVVPSTVHHLGAALQGRSSRG